jgi:hypothetical protein
MSEIVLMKEGGPQRIDLLKVTGLISGRARSRSKTARCIDSRSSLWNLFMVQSPRTLLSWESPVLALPWQKVQDLGCSPTNLCPLYLTAANPEPCLKPNNCCCRIAACFLNPNTTYPTLGIWVGPECLSYYCYNSKHPNYYFLHEMKPGECC